LCENLFLYFYVRSTVIFHINTKIFHHSKIFTITRIFLLFVLFSQCMWVCRSLNRVIKLSHDGNFKHENRFVNHTYEHRENISLFHLLCSVFFCILLATIFSECYFHTFLAFKMTLKKIDDSINSFGLLCKNNSIKHRDKFSIKRRY